LADNGSPGSEGLDFESWSCPMPLRDSPVVVMGHGGGGALSAELVEHLFVPALGTPELKALGDSTVLSLGGAEMATNAIWRPSGEKVGYSA